MMADKIKSRWWNANEGRQEIKEFTAYEIVKTPNYHQPEVIIAAVCKVVAELADAELERRQNVKNYLNQAKGSKDEQVQI